MGRAIMWVERTMASETLRDMEVCGHGRASRSCQNLENESVKQDV